MGGAILHGRRLGPTQTLVLHLLAARGDSTVRDLTNSGFGLSEGSIYSAIYSLGQRGLVDVMKWEGQRRIFGLTLKGAAHEASLLDDDEGRRP